MRRILGFILLLFSAMLGSAQTTAVIATVTDLDGTVWANGTWSLAFVTNPNNPNPAAYNINGTPLDPTVTNQHGVMNGSGALSFSAYQNSVVSPAGSGWKLTVCPNAVTQCGTYNFTAVGASMDLSSALTPVIPAPRFAPVSGTYGYNDAEAIIQLKPGSTYWNVTSAALRCYTGSSWVTCGGGGSTPAPPNGSYQFNNNSTLGGNSQVLNAQAFAGSTFDVKVKNCIAAIISAGGGICDATSLSGAQTMASSITVGSHTVPVTLLLGASVITRSTGAQFIYIGNGVTTGSRIIGSGKSSTIINSTSGDTSAVFFSGESVGTQVWNLEIANLNANIDNIAGAIIVDCTNCVWSNIHDNYFTGYTAISYGGNSGGAYYNTSLNNFIHGATNAVVYNIFANQNFSYGGQQWGSDRGIWINGGVHNLLYSPDIEGGGTLASIELNGDSNVIYSPYIESSGHIVIDNAIGGSYIAGNCSLGAIEDNSSNADNFWQCEGQGGQSIAPSHLVAGDYYFGTTMDTGTNQLLKFTRPPGSLFAEFLYNGASINTYGLNGHAGINLGHLGITSGVKGNGQIATSALATPAAPTLTATGGTGTTYTYYLVCHDGSDGVTLPSAAATVSGPASLDATHYITISPPAEDGCVVWDVLKTNTATRLTLAPVAAAWIDNGVATTAYTTPTRNTTADLNIGGISFIIPPTSCTGLVTGTLWNNAGTLAICP